MPYTKKNRLCCQIHPKKNPFFIQGQDINRYVTCKHCVGPICSIVITNSRIRCIHCGGRATYDLGYGYQQEHNYES